jgi:hypothetical protein
MTRFLPDLRTAFAKHGLWFALAKLCFVSMLMASTPTSPEISDARPLALPGPGAHQMRILSPTLLELTLITTSPAPAPGKRVWDFEGTGTELHLPSPEEFVVLVEDGRIPVHSVGFKRRVLYAPLKSRDLRIGNYLYLKLARSISDFQKVEVKNPSARLWSQEMRFTATADPLRFSPAIHVNQVGYPTGRSKKAMVGYYLGSLGEMDIDPQPGFTLVRSEDGKEVYAGRLVSRPDQGFPSPAYQKVWEADFSEWQAPGEYLLSVAGLGVSFPFLIDPGMVAAFARTYALGLYHQRCGTANEIPYTRHTHVACHTAMAEIPTSDFAITQKFLAEASADYTNTTHHFAPPLKGIAASLYPYVRQGKIDVSGGHHDAGDYSKYTINSAAFIHYLVFAVDTFPGVGELDNLGIPESGDGKSDLLQEAKWEADFLAKMQDADGGFYFLVYPRDRRYESDVPPERGDSQVVWPKNTAATAAAVAALAQCASSPLFKKQFPAEAASYWRIAVKGWLFLEQALSRFGKEGSYQKLTHYGNDFTHDDELAWAACEMFLATGDSAYHRKLIAWLNPASPATRKWGWWRLYEGYGCAIRSYAFAAKSGRVRRDHLDAILLSHCEEEIEQGGVEQFRRARESAYGTSFPAETKRARSAGWYFSTDRALDLATACQLDYPTARDPRPQWLEAILSNLNYEAGGNPVNVTYVTGLGWKRQREVVHQYAQNDRRILPPSGIPLGNIQSGFGWLENYKLQLGALTYPPDSAREAAYPMYDRWGDSFNVQTEFVIVNQARSLACLSFLMAQTPLKNQSWKPTEAQIAIHETAGTAAGRAVTARLKVSDLDLRHARIVWEARDQEPAYGPTFTFMPVHAGQQWVEVEAQWPDGRRAFAATNFTASIRIGITPDNLAPIK